MSLVCRSLLCSCCESNSFLLDYNKALVKMRYCFESQIMKYLIEKQVKGSKFQLNVIFLYGTVCGAYIGLHIHQTYCMGLNGFMWNRPLDEWCISNMAELQQSIKDTKTWQTFRSIYFPDVCKHVPLHYSWRSVSADKMHMWMLKRLHLHPCNNFDLSELYVHWMRPEKDFTLWAQDTSILWHALLHVRHAVGFLPRCSSLPLTISKHVCPFTYCSRSCITSELAETLGNRRENIQIYVKLANMLTQSRLSYAQKTQL